MEWNARCAQHKQARTAYNKSHDWLPFPSRGFYWRFCGSRCGVSQGREKTKTICFFGAQDLEKESVNIESAGLCQLRASEIFLIWGGETGTDGPSSLMSATKIDRTQRTNKKKAWLLCLYPPNFVVLWSPIFRSGGSGGWLEQFGKKTNTEFVFWRLRWE